MAVSGEYGPMMCKINLRFLINALHMTVCMSLVTLYMYIKMRTEQKSGFDRDGYFPLFTKKIMRKSEHI